MKLNSDYRNAASAALKGNWAPAVVAAIVLIAVNFLLAGSYPFRMVPEASGGAALLISIFLLGPVSLGAANAYKKLYLEADVNVTANIFNFGFTNYLHVAVGYLLMRLYTFLWSLLLFVPGIVKYYAYAMTPYILVDNPELGPDQAIHRSRQMMLGRKMSLFTLDLSFIGWFLLSLITCGIGFFWLIPYFQTARAAFYTDVKADWEAGNFTASATI